MTKAKIPADLPANAQGFIAPFPRRLGKYAVYFANGALSNVFANEQEAREAASECFALSPEGYLIPK
jgi:hypothetical protein